MEALAHKALAALGDAPALSHRVAERIKHAIKHMPHGVSYTLAAAAGAYVVTYMSRTRRPRITYQGDGIAAQILERCYFPVERYWPHPLVALGGMVSTMHLGTMLPYAACGVATVPYVEQMVLDDGGTVALSWWRCPATARRRDVAVVFPGLNNSSETGFVRALMKRLDAAGFLAVCYDGRGTGAAGALTSARPHSADAWRDFDAVLWHVSREAGAGSRLFCLGQSLGGAILTKYLTTTAFPAIAAAATVSAPRAFSNTDKSCRDGWFKRAQNFCITVPLKLSWVVQGRPGGRTKEVMQSTTVRDIERLVICEPWGHASPDEYYEANDGTHDLSRVGVPLLVVAAADDNILDFSEDGRYSIPDAALVAQNPAKVAAARTVCGGHLSFLDVTGESWADGAAVEWLAEAARLLPPADGDAMYRYAVDRVVANRKTPSNLDLQELCRSSSSATPKGERRRSLPSMKGVLTGM